VWDAGRGIWPRAFDSSSFSTDVGDRVTSRPGTDPRLLNGRGCSSPRQGFAPNEEGSSTRGRDLTLPAERALHGLESGRGPVRARQDRTALDSPVLVATAMEFVVAPIQAARREVKARDGGGWSPGGWLQRREHKNRSLEAAMTSWGSASRGDAYP